MDESHPRVLIACPVYEREWILPYWFKAIERQNFPLSNLGFMFELGPNDDATHDVLWTWHEKHPDVICFDGEIQMNKGHQTHPEGERMWSQVRYLTMADFRNSLLDKATAMSDKFDYYFSLDSDILLKDPETLNKLILYSELYKDFVISPLSYMTPEETKAPSIMSWELQPGGRALRYLDEYPIGEPFPADIVMAAVLMPKQIFTNVRYRAHRQGEDLGFAFNLARQGFKSLAASDIECPHIMHRWMMDAHVKSWLSLDS